VNFAPSFIAFIERWYNDGNFGAQRDLLAFIEFQFEEMLDIRLGTLLSCTSTAIMASWLKTEFDCETREAATYRIVNEAKIRQGDAFRKVWLFDYRPPRTRQAASQRWRWINEDSFRKKKQRFVKK
jgi:hypothetical protein